MRLVDTPMIGNLPMISVCSYHGFQIKRSGSAGKDRHMNAPVPFMSKVRAVEKDWIDYNGHLNMAFYNVLFDRCSDDAFEHMGMGPGYAQNRKMTVYTAEIHVCYVRELHLHHETVCSFQICDHDDKRLHIYKELRHRDGWLAATSENLYLHIDMAGPKVAPFPTDIMENVAAMATAHASLPPPERMGRSIAIRRR